MSDRRRPSRQIVLMETNDGQVTLTRFDPDTVLHQVVNELDVVFEYTIRDLLDEVDKSNPRVPIPPIRDMILDPVVKESHA